MIQKRFSGIAVIILAMATAGQGQVLKDGPHVAFPTGGDTVNPSAAVGWQVAYEYTDLLSLEFAATRMSDSLDGEDLGVGPFPVDGNLDLDMWSLGITIRAGMLVGERAYVYVGAGAAYHTFTDKDMQSVNAKLRKTPVPAARGGTLTSAHMELDAAFAYHAVVGLEFLIVPSWEAFLELRMSALSTDSELTLVETVPNTSGGTSNFAYSRDGTFDYDYGMVRLGVNYRF